MDILVISNILNHTSKILFNGVKHLDADDIDFINDPLTLDLTHLKQILNMNLVLTGGAELLKGGLPGGSTLPANIPTDIPLDRTTARKAHAVSSELKELSSKGLNRLSAITGADPSKMTDIAEGTKPLTKKEIDMISKAEYDEKGYRGNPIKELLTLLTKILIFPFIFIALMIFPYIYVTYASFKKVNKLYKNNILTM